MAILRRQVINRSPLVTHQVTANRVSNPIADTCMVHMYVVNKILGNDADALAQPNCSHQGD